MSKVKLGTQGLKRGFAKMVKNGVIMDVTTAEQAKIAEKAGAVAVMALEKVPADIRAAGGVARMADPAIVTQVVKSVTIPVMAKARIGHLAEAAVLETCGVDMIDESEVLTPVDEEHLDKTKYTIPFVCGARNLGEALRRINEGAAMIRTKGEPGTGDVAEAVRHLKLINKQISELKGKNAAFMKKKAKEYRVPVKLVQQVAKLQRLPVVNFAAGGIATPADAALMMMLGADGVFVGSGIFKSKTPNKMAKAIVEATMNYNKPEIVARVSRNLGEAMKGTEAKKLQDTEKMQVRGN